MFLFKIANFYIINRSKIKGDYMKITIFGMGYVGLPLAIAFSKHFETDGFDIDRNRIQELKKNIDRTKECSDYELNNAKITFTSEIDELTASDVFIITVPTPIDEFNIPNLEPLRKVSSIIATKMEKGAIVILESTVYPGTTREVVIPILEKISGLNYLKDFSVGYSPERINPGDPERKLSSIPKVISGSDPATCETLHFLYSKIVSAGLHVAETIEVAEASKIIENIQRDVNIALINELKIVLDAKNINIFNVLAAASTKWNFHNYFPGLVGGHCIGVDPYYLSHTAKKDNLETRLINSARHINSFMANYEAISFCKKLMAQGAVTKSHRVLVMGMTFKEDCPDLRNSQVPKLITEIEDFGIRVDVIDPYISPELVTDFNVLQDLSIIKNSSYDGIFVAVAHSEFRCIGLRKIKNWLKPHGIFYDIKNIVK